MSTKLNVALTDSIRFLLLVHSLAFPESTSGRFKSYHLGWSRSFCVPAVFPSPFIFCSSSCISLAAVPLGLSRNDVTSRRVTWFSWCCISIGWCDFPPRDVTVATVAQRLKYAHCNLTCNVIFGLLLSLVIICLLLLNLLFETSLGRPDWFTVQAWGPLTILTVVWPSCFAFRSHAVNAFESSSWHSVHNVSATFYHYFAHPERSVPIGLCIPNWCVDSFSVMLLAPIMKVVCPLGFAFQLCMRIVFKSCFRNTALLPIMKLVCPLSFAFQICLQIVSQSCFWHTVRMDSATLCYFAAHHESSVPIGFCLRCCVFWWLPWLSFSCVPMVLPWLLVACRDLGRLPSTICLLDYA